MINISAELFAIVDLLTDNDLQYAVCGGLAVAVHGYPRATQDIDMVIQTADLPRAQKLLSTIGYTIPGGIIRLRDRFRRGTPGLSSIQNGWRSTFDA